MSSSKRRKDKEFMQRQRLKIIVGIIFGLLYAAGAVLMILLVALSVKQSVADAIFYSFLIQIAHDILINQPLRVFIQMLLILALKRDTCLGQKKLILAILDANVVTAFI